MNEIDKNNYGPLGQLIGEWEGVKGVDEAPGMDLKKATSPYREKISFEPMGLVANHQQSLYALRYRTTAWRTEEVEPFHEDQGYWLWDLDRRCAMRCFVVPRGISLIAGGEVEPDAKNFSVRAERGSTTFGILSNPFLDREFRTERFEMKIEVTETTFRYRQDTQIQMHGASEIFHHIDENELKRAGR